MDLAGGPLELDALDAPRLADPGICRFGSRSSMPRTYQSPPPAHYEARRASKEISARPALEVDVTRDKLVFGMAEDSVAETPAS